jgi:hypothetical protein
VVNGQNLKNLGLDTEWRPGTIVLKDNTILKGLIQYNTQFGVIHFKETKDEESIPLQEKRVLKMSFLDKETSLTRSFHMFTLRDTLRDKEYDLLFEIIKDYKDFGVLSRRSTTAMFFSGYRADAPDFMDELGLPKPKVFSQIELIMFVNNRQKLEPVLAIQDIEYDGYAVDYTKSKSKLIKEKVIKDYTGQHWDTLSKYIKEHKLKLNRKDDLMRVLDHFEQLSILN